MSYNLFLRPRSGELSREALLEYFTGTSGYALDDDDEDVIAYENEATGVYFRFQFDPGTGDAGEDDDEDDDAGGGGDGPELSFELDAFRPSIFALEARIELDALVAAFDLQVTDPQDGGIEGATWDGDAFIRGWTRLNELNYTTILRDEWDPDEPLYTLPRAESSTAGAGTSPTRRAWRRWGSASSSPTSPSRGGTGAPWCRRCGPTIGPS